MVQVQEKHVSWTPAHRTSAIVPGGVAQTYLRHGAHDSRKDALVGLALPGRRRRQELGSVGGHREVRQGAACAKRPARSLC